MTPLVSILIPAYNAERWIRETLQSAIQQSWQHKEIIVVDDGSTDNTFHIARQFESPSVKVVAQENEGGGAARNRALSLAQGDYIQYIDHDDLLAPDKIARQLERVHAGDEARALLSGSFSTFFYCTERARPVHNSMCQDLRPVEFFLHKYNDDAWLQIAAYLFSRELVEMAGPWYGKQSTDDDGNYVDRAVMSCEQVRYVPEARSYWRIGNTKSAGHRNTKQMREAAFEVTVRSVNQLLSLENSERTRAACLRFLVNRVRRYFLKEPEMLAKLEILAATLGGGLSVPETGQGPSLGNKSINWRRSRIVEWYVYSTTMFVKKNIDRHFWKRFYSFRSGIS